MRQNVEIITNGRVATIKLDGVELTDIVGYTIEHKAGEPPVLHITRLCVPRSMMINGVGVDVTSMADTALRIVPLS